MNIAALIASFSTGTYTVTRTARGTTTRGKTAAGTASTFSISACVYPVPPGELKRLPEGRRATDSLRVVTATELQLGGQGDAYEADMVSIRGESWEVSVVSPWQDPLSGSIGYDCLVTVVR